MAIKTHINNIVGSVMLKNFAQADIALKKVVQEKLQGRYNKEYNAIKKQFFGK